MSVKETKDVLDFLKMVPGAVDEIAKDGKFGLMDLFVLKKLADPAKDAVDNVAQMRAELSYLTKDELLVVVGDVYEIAVECARVFHKYVK